MSTVCARRWGLMVLGLALVGPAWGAEKTEPADRAAELRLGRELFVREWLPQDPRSHGGDGLGPVFNDTSCVACHNLGGVGGGGPRNKNVDIISVHRHDQQQAIMPLPAVPNPGGTTTELIFRNLIAMAKAKPKLDPEVQRKELAQLHPGFVSGRSLVLHKFSSDPQYGAWRQQRLFPGMQFFVSPAGEGVTFATQSVEELLIPGTDAGLVPPQGDELKAVQPEDAEIQQQQQTIMFSNNAFGGSGNQTEHFATTSSQRNTTALFGAGLLDAIPDAVLEAAAARKFEEFPSISGRVARLKDGKIGRFGWKAQKASLHEFAMTACAVELGLQVPTHPQAGAPDQPDYAAPGLDMDEKECVALVSFLKGIPAPEVVQVEESVASEIKAGREKFAAIGCAACHTAELGEVAGVYSDLLLHDMGPELGDTGSYGVFLPNESENPDEPIPGFTDKDEAPKKGQPLIGALRQEWRTAPLWGLRDSAPYLHDGRAETIAQAVAFHGGEGKASARAFFRLTAKEKSQVEAFLKTLIAPTAVASR